MENHLFNLRDWSRGSTFGTFLRDFYHRSVVLNYRFELLPGKKEVDDIEFRTFEYLTEVQTDVTLTRLLATLSDDDVFFDVGSNVGHFLIPILKKYPTPQAVGFEFSPRNFNRQERNLKVNGLFDTVAINHLALSDEPGTEQFYKSSLHEISSFYRKHSTSGRAQAKKVDIEVQTLDGLVYGDGLTPPTYIKIDVEGHALHALRGGRELFQEFTPSVFVECHGNREDVQGILTDFGCNCKEEPRRNAIYAT